MYIFACYRPIIREQSVILTSVPACGFYYTLHEKNVETKVSFFSSDETIGDVYLQKRSGILRVDRQKTVEANERYVRSQGIKQLERIVQTAQQMRTPLCTQAMEPIPELKAIQDFLKELE